MKAAAKFWAKLIGTQVKDAITEVLKGLIFTGIYTLVREYMIKKPLKKIMSIDLKKGIVKTVDEYMSDWE